MRTLLGMRLAALALLALFSIGVRAEAASITLSPSSQNVLNGSSVFVDILVSGLNDPTESVGGVSLFLSFDDTRLQGIAYDLDPDGKMGPVLSDASFGFGPGGTSDLDLFWAADVGWDNTMLTAAQGDGFVLATIEFLALAPGLANLAVLHDYFGEGLLSNADGTETIGVTAFGDATVCIDCEATPVPEPATLSLLGAGAAATLVRRVRRRKTE